VLSKWRVTCDVAEDGVEALAKIKNNLNYDVILMDVFMPEMGGIEATQVIRANPDPYFQNLPIIALTASSESELDGVFEAGMNDYVQKPFEPQALFNKLIQYQRA